MAKEKPLVLSGRQFVMADFEFARFGVRVPAGTTLKQILAPEYFRNHAQRLKPGTRIEVVSDDNSLDADLRVLRVTNTSVSCYPLRVHEEAQKGAKTNDKKGKPEVLSNGVTVEWGGPNHKHRIMHAGEIVQHGFAQKGEAVAAAKAYIEGL